jgi:hypothetical protein
MHGCIKTFIYPYIHLTSAPFLEVGESVLFALSSPLVAAAFLPKTKSNMGRRKVLGRIYKAGPGKNSHRPRRGRRAQVSQHQCQGVMTEATPPPATVVAVTPVMAETPAHEIRMAQSLSSLSFNGNSYIDFDSIPCEVVNTGKAFKYNSRSGKERSDAAIRKAKSRASNVLVDAINNCGNDLNERTAALAAALAHPDIQDITKNVVITDPETSEMMRNAFTQQRRIIERATEKENTRGRCGNGKRSFVESVFVSMAASPDQKPGPKRKTLIEAIGIPVSTGYRLMANAEKKRRLLSENTVDSVSWANVQSRKGYSKVSPEIRSKFLEWFMAHPYVVESPISNETVLVHNLLTGAKERVNKLLLQISIRELHNDMLLPPDQGGFVDAWDESGNPRISDTALRALLPEQARKMTPRHKQMCGCEVCIQIGSLQQSLNAWRHRRLKLLTELANAAMSEDERQGIEIRKLLYKNTVMPNDEVWHPQPKMALKAIQCKPADALGYPHWNCVLGRCFNCPKYPIPEEECGRDEQAPTIKFHKYANVTECSLHGVLTLRAKECLQCEALPEGLKPGRVGTRKQLVKMDRPIGEFMENHYIPALQKYAYHQPHVNILSKFGCEGMRHKAFQNEIGWVSTSRDYAERLPFKFNLEIQSEHFGNGRNLSIEGSTVETHTAQAIQAGVVNVELTDKEKYPLQIHSHFSDDSRQDAATTTAHMEVLLKHLQASGEIGEHATMLDSTDGCSKQYRCAKAYWLLSYLAFKFKIVIDRAIGAPGHGKGRIDGINATDKQYLATRMCLNGTPEANDGEKRRMAAESILDGTTKKSLACEAVRMCSTTERLKGVKGDKKHAKREGNAKMQMRHYHIQEKKDVKHTNVTFKAEGLPDDTKHSHCYNIRADWELGLGCVAMRRIPCACESCLEQLKQPWDTKLTKRDNQPRYAKGNRECALWPIFQGLNDWHLVQLIRVPSKIAALETLAQEELFEAQVTILNGIAEEMAEGIEVGKIGAFSTEDEETSGYYLVEWKSEAYTLQEDTVLTEFDPPLKLEAGELVADATYLNMVPRAPLWYTPSESTTTVRVKQVLVAKLNMLSTSEGNKVPRGCNKREVERLGGKRLVDADHEEILDERMRRVALDHEEITRAEYYESGDESDNDDDGDTGNEEGDDNEQ